MSDLARGFRTRPASGAARLGYPGLTRQRRRVPAPRPRMRRRSASGCAPSSGGLGARRCAAHVVPLPHQTRDRRLPGRIASGLPFGE